MRALNKRLAALESDSPELLWELSEVEIERRLYRIMCDIEDAGVRLPAHWQEQFKADPVRLVEHVGEIVRNMP